VRINGRQEPMVSFLTFLHLLLSDKEIERENVIKRNGKGDMLE
jgi:hypothetical protein